jgi:hypothetical protein
MSSSVRCITAFCTALYCHTTSATADTGQDSAFIPVETRVCVYPDPQKNQEGQKPWNGFVVSIGFKTSADGRVVADQYRVNDRVGRDEWLIKAANVRRGVCI